MTWVVGWNERRHKPDHRPYRFHWHQEAVKFLEDELWYLGADNDDVGKEVAEAILELEDSSGEVLFNIGRYEYWIRKAIDRA